MAKTFMKDESRWLCNSGIVTYEHDNGTQFEKPKQHHGHSAGHEKLLNGKKARAKHFREQVAEKHGGPLQTAASSETARRGKEKGS